MHPKYQDYRIERQEGVLTDTYRVHEEWRQWKVEESRQRGKGFTLQEQNLNIRGQREGNGQENSDR
jgi:hypothetical protein